MILDFRNGIKLSTGSGATIVIVLIVLLAPMAAAAQSPSEQVVESKPNTAVLQGMFQDDRKNGVAGAPVSLKEAEAPYRGLMTRTDSSGHYRFPDLPPGDYQVSAQVGCLKAASSGSIKLSPGESKTLDLIAKPSSASSKEPSTTQPAFSDDVHFTVAGLTDTTNLGGHGSDVVVRNRESLAEATALLNKDSVSIDASAEESLRKKLSSNPNDYESNYALGKWLLDADHAEKAMPYLKQAAEVNPADFEAHNDLGLAYVKTGNFSAARAQARSLSKCKPSLEHSAKMQHLLGVIDEGSNHPLAAVREYQEAAKLDATESNLFDWGAELLIHHASDPALEVFAKGNRSFPHSARMLEGMAAALYARGSNEDAMQRLIEASDMNPNDPHPYLFMGKMESDEDIPFPEVTERLARFASLHTEDAMAHYYYAVALWKGRRSPDDISIVERVENLLRKAVQLEPGCGLAFFQLGVIEADQRDFSAAIADYQNAIAVAPRLEQAHYRLAQLYRQNGEAAKAREELQIYRRISQEQATKIDRQRHDLQQFVYQLQDKASAPAPAPSQ